MLLTPRYDGPAVLRFEVPIGDPAVPLLRQRRRLGELLAGLDAVGWATASRCEGWSVRDVIAHLVGTNQFWVISAAAALAGEPTRYLQGFDPAVTPGQMVDGMEAMDADAVLGAYLEGVDALADVVGGLDEAQWQSVAEAPPGLISLHGLVLHALWDAWIHERDVALPLGVEPVVETDEVTGCLRYVGGLGPAFGATRGATRRGALVLEGTDPDVRVVVEVGESTLVRDGDAPDGAVRVTAPTIDLVEALSFRGPWPVEIAVEDRWLLGDLGVVFDAVPAG